LGHKRAKRDGFDLDGGLETTLGTAIGASVDNEAFDDADGKVTLNSAMVNVLGDFGADDGLSFYAGVGAGRAWARALDDGDKAWAFQAIAGVRSPISENIDIGLKYRYFRTQELNFEGGPLGVGGPLRVANFNPSLNGKYRSHSLLASLIFNFGAPAEPAPVIAPPPPPPPAPPATQTCPDGSVILATDVCPAPPPPPPPAPAGERG
jgi:opacity protein-like surface antigen